MAKSEIPMEIERKYLIRMPDTSFLRTLDGCDVSEIEQTYLPDPAPGVTERVRLRRHVDRTVCTHTLKVRVSQNQAREEESEISLAEYRALLARRDPSLQTVRKTRFAFFIGGQPYEVDVYPFWTRVAVLETELTDPDRYAPIPPFLSVIREVTGEAGYSNRDLARRIPPEPKTDS